MPRKVTADSPTTALTGDYRALPGDAALRLPATFDAIRAWLSTASHRDRAMAASGFPLAGDVPAFLTLTHLAYRGYERPTEIADAIQTGRSNVSKVVGRLEAAGLVVRAADPRDDRSVVILLTAEGRVIADRLERLSQEFFVTALADWDPADVETLEHLLARLVGRMQQVVPD